MHCTIERGAFQGFKEEGDYSWCSCFDYWHQYWFWDSCSAPENFSCSNLSLSLPLCCDLAWGVGPWWAHLSYEARVFFVCFFLGIKITFHNWWTGNLNLRPLLCRWVVISIIWGYASVVRLEFKNFDLMREISSWSFAVF